MNTVILDFAPSLWALHLAQRTQGVGAPAPGRRPVTRASPFPTVRTQPRRLRSPRGKDLARVSPSRGRHKGGAREPGGARRKRRAPVHPGRSSPPGSSGPRGGTRPPPQPCSLVSAPLRTPPCSSQALLPELHHFPAEPGDPSWGPTPDHLALPTP